jgi:ribose 5-phosphate isomerase A
MSPEEAKKNAGIHAAGFVKQGMKIGIGSGSTVFWFIRELGERIKQGLEITAVPTSIKTEQLAKEAGIMLSDLNTIDRLMLTIDGADEIDPCGQLIKGGGGALLQEKIVAAASDKLIIVADSSKLVKQLGQFPLPVEVIPFGYKQVQQQIISSGICRSAGLRKKDNEIFITDHHHYILDCEYEKINDPAALNIDLHLIAGVMETGLFINMANTAVIGYGNGSVEVIEYKRAG